MIQKRDIFLHHIYSSFYSVKTKSTQMRIYLYFKFNLFLAQQFERIAFNDRKEMYTIELTSIF